MADHNHQIGIDITADEGNYVAAVGRAEKETDKLTASMKRAEEAATGSTREGEKLIEKLRRQAETYNMTASELRAYEAAHVNMSEVQRAAVDGYLNKLDQLENGSGILDLLPGKTAIVIAAVVAMGAAYLQADKDVERSAQAIVVSGNAAGTSLQGMANAARAAAENIGSTQLATSAAMQQIVASGQVAAQSLQMVGEATVSWQRATGVAVAQTVKEFEELGRSPVQASLKLNEQYNYLTSAVFAQIKALDEQGKSERAAEVAQRAYADALKERSADMEADLSLMTRMWRGLGDAARFAGETMTAAFRETTRLERIQQLEQKAAPGRGMFSGVSEEEAAELRRLKFAESAANERASAEAAANAQEQARIKWLQEGDKYLSKQAQMEREVAKAREAGAQAGLSQTQIEERLGQIREKYATKTPKAREKSDPLADVRAEALGQEVGLSASTVKSLEKLDEQLAKGKVGLAEYDRLLGAILDKDPVLKREQDEINKATEDYVKAVEAAVAPLEREAAQLERKEELTRRSRSEIELSIVAQLEEARAVAEANGAKEQQLAVLDREIAARRRIAESSAAIDAAKVAEEASKKAQQEADRLSDTMSRSVADGLMRGFEKGEDFFDVFLKTLKNAAATAILQPIIKPIVDPIAQGMSEVGKGIGSWISNIFSSWHTGGVPGLDAPAYTHALPSGLFAAAPRYHSGAIAGDEVATVLQRGEGVFTEGQMKKLAPVEDAAPKISVVFENKGTAKAQTAQPQMRFNGKEYVITVFMDDWKNNGPIRQTIEA